MGTIVVWVSLGIVVLVIASLVPIWRSYRHLVVGNRVAVAEGSMLLKTASGPIEYATAGHGFPVLISHGGSGGYDQGLMTARLYIGEGLMAGGSGTPNTVTPTASRSSSFTAIPIPGFYMDSCLVAPSDLVCTSSRRTGQAMAFRISIRLVAVSRTTQTTLCPPTIREPPKRSAKPLPWT